MVQRLQWDRKREPTHLLEDNMNTPLFIAKRYLFSKKSVNAINIISGISTLGVLIGSAALIIILSVFNGFELLILNMYSSFTPEIRIEPKVGKSFELPADLEEYLSQQEGIAHYTEVLQEKVLLRYGQNQYIANLKGENMRAVPEAVADSLLFQGKFVLKEKETNYAVVGAAIQAYLGINLKNDQKEISIYSPRKGVINSLNPAEEFNLRSIPLAGILMAQPVFDNVIIVPLSFARDVLDEPDRMSAVEIYVDKDADPQYIERSLIRLFGDQFLIKNRAQQNPTLYKVLNSEKWAIFFILTFVLIIAIFNIIGSLTMLVIDKKRDIAVLKSLGASDSFIKKIFFSEGMFISLLGCVVGMILGLSFCLLQQEYGLIKMDEAALVTSVFPISIKVTDFILVFATVTTVAFIASYVSSHLSVKGEEALS